MAIIIFSAWQKIEMFTVMLRVDPWI